MRFDYISSFENRNESDCLIVPFYKEGEAVSEELPPLLKSPLSLGDFKGGFEELAFIYTEKEKDKRFLLLGLGEREKLTSEKLRAAYAIAIKACLEKKIKKVNVLFPGDRKEAQTIAEALLLANYHFVRLKHDSLKENPPFLIESAAFFGISSKEQKAVEKAKLIATGVHFVRDLVNSNADDKPPMRIVEAAKELEKLSSDLSVTVLNKKEIEAENMGLLLAVNRASHIDPAFIIMEYRGNPGSKDITGLVGKGIIFDTGGLCLKPGSGPSSMASMKSDMSGAAAVLGTIYVAALLKLPVNIVGALPLTENAVGASAYKPGDVYKGKSGKTVEIVTTDAEGRLILADALTYIQEKFKVSRVIDIASLTGAIVVALGDEISGYFANDDELAAELEDAAKITGEHLWRFPLYQDYKKILKSEIADIKNAGDRKASSITSALFLQEFVKDSTSWVHIDIAGTDYLSNPRSYYPTAGTGVGVRLLIQFLENHG